MASALTQGSADMEDELVQDDGIFLFAASKNKITGSKVETELLRKEEEINLEQASKEPEVKATWEAKPRKRAILSFSKEDLPNALITTETILKFSKLYTPKVL